MALFWAYCGPSSLKAQILMLDEHVKNVVECVQVLVPMLPIKHHDEMRLYEEMGFKNLTAFLYKFLLVCEVQKTH